MGAASYPEYVKPQYTSQGYNELVSGNVKNVVNSQVGATGLPENIKDEMRRKGLGGISGGLMAGNMALKENGLKMPNNTYLGNIAKLYSGVGSQVADLEGSIAQKDFDSKLALNQAGVANYANLFDSSNRHNLGMNKLYSDDAALRNRFNQEEWNKTNWISMLGPILQTAGMMGGMMLGGKA